MICFQEQSFEPLFPVGWFVTVIICMQYCFWHSALSRYAWFCCARRKGERLLAIPGWDMSWGSGVWDGTGEPLTAGEKRDVLARFFFFPFLFFFPSSCEF